MFAERLLLDKFIKEKKEYHNWTELLIPLQIFSSDIALLLNEVEAYNIASSYDIGCQIFLHPRKYFAWGTSSFVFQKDFALKEIIDYHLQKYKESGVMRHLAKKYLSMIRQDCNPPLRELSFKATFLSFALLFVGLVIAMVCFMVEKILFRKGQFITY